MAKRHVNPWTEGYAYNEGDFVSIEERMDIGEGRYVLLTQVYRAARDIEESTEANRPGEDAKQEEMFMFTKPWVMIRTAGVKAMGTLDQPIWEQGND